MPVLISLDSVYEDTKVSSLCEKVGTTFYQGILRPYYVASEKTDTKRYLHADKDCRYAKEDREELIGERQPAYPICSYCTSFQGILSSVEALVDVEYSFELLVERWSRKEVTKRDASEMLKLFNRLDYTTRQAGLNANTAAEKTGVLELAEKMKQSFVSSLKEHDFVASMIKVMGCEPSGVKALLYGTHQNLLVELAGTSKEGLYLVDSSFVEVLKLMHPFWKEGGISTMEVPTYFFETVFKWYDSSTLDGFTPDMIDAAVKLWEPKLGETHHDLTKLTDSVRALF